MKAWLALALFVRAALTEERTSFNILDFGATPGGHVACTAALRAAVAAASAAGGGEVLVPAGLQFLTGAFSLASHVTLRLDGVLLASTDVGDYPASGWDWDPALIDTHNATSTGIVGSGRIEGQAVPAWVDHYDALKGWIPRTWAGVHGCVGECRPKLVRFTDCSHVMIAGVEVLNAPDWSILLRRTSFAQLRRLRVHGDPRWPNGDALDIETGEHITIEDVDFSTGDDCIAISSGNTNPLRWPWPGAAGPVRHLSVRNATLSSRSSAIKLSAVHFGELADHGELTNLTFSNIRIVDSSRGLGFQQRSGSGVWHAIAFENVTIDATRYPTGKNWWSSGEPIWMTSVAQSAADAPLTGTVRDILFKNIVARGENGVLLSGGAVAPMSGLVFDNVSITVGVYGNTSCAKGAPHTTPTGCRDYRPRSEGAVVLSPTSVFAFEGNGSATLRDVTARFDGPAAAYWLPPTDGGLCRQRGALRAALLLARLLKRTLVLPPFWSTPRGGGRAVGLSYFYDYAAFAEHWPHHREASALRALPSPTSFHIALDDEHARAEHEGTIVFKARSRGGASETQLRAWLRPWASERVLWFEHLYHRFSRLDDGSEQAAFDAKLRGSLRPAPALAAVIARVSRALAARPAAGTTNEKRGYNCVHASAADLEKNGVKVFQRAAKLLPPKAPTLLATDAPSTAGARKDMKKHFSRIISTAAQLRPQERVLFEDVDGRVTLALELLDAHVCANARM